ncbi:hypothetical protein CASFOL_033095 [Castilleja foliolosa]|uniref:Titin-like n=1 Tax=Castilleja foliolosa TaxID=1961234 RepID=A0ABD3C4P0_9LAMI
MATEADIQAPVSETRKEELGESNKIPNIELTREEKTQQADTLNEPCTVDQGENFLETPSTSKVHSEVRSDDSTEKPEIRGDGSFMEHEGSEKESEKLLETEMSTGKANENESAVDNNVRDENAYLCRGEPLESEKITSVVMNDDLHVVSENSNKTKGYLEEKSTNANLQAITSDVTEDKIEDGEATKAGPCETETSTRSMLPEIESNIEKPEDSLNVASEDIKTSDSSYEIETSSIEEQRETAHPRDGKTDDKAALDADEVKEEIHENVQPIVPNEEMEENSLIRVNGSQLKDENLEKVSEKPSVIKDNGQEIETSSSEEQSAHSQIILDQKIEDKALDAVETKDINVESTNVASEIPHEHTEDILAGQVDCSHTENDEHLEKESEILHLAEAPVEETKDNEFKLHESKDLIKAELLENERNTATTSVKEETQEEKHTNYLQDTHDDTNASESTHVTDMSSTEEEIPTAEPQEISIDEKQEMTTADAAKTHELQNATTTTSYEDSEDNSQKQVDVSQLEQIKHYEKVSENKPLTEASARDTVENALEEQSTNVNLHAITSDVTEDKNEDGEATKAGPCENEISPRSTLPEIESNIEKPEDSSNVASEDIKTSDSNYEIETRSNEEQRATAHPQDGNTNDKSVDIKEEILENVSTIYSIEKTEENSSIQVGGPQKKNAEHLEKDIVESSLGNEDLLESEKKSSNSMNKDLDRQATNVNEHDGNTIDITEVKKIDAAINIQNEVFENSSKIGSNEETEEKAAIEADCSELQEKESEKPSLAEPLEREASDNEFIVMHEARIEDGEPLERKAELHETETSKRSVLTEIESKIEKQEDSLNVASEDIKTSDSSHHEAETSYFEEKSATAYPQDGETGDKAALNEDEVKEEIHENIQPIVPNEEMEENSYQVDGWQKKDENLEKVGEKPSMTKERGQEIETSSSEEQSAQSQLILDQKIEDKALDAAETKDINVESTVMREAEISNESITKVGSCEDDKNIESALLKKENFQEAAEDHKTSVSHEDIETTCSIDETSLTTNPQSIMSGKTTDATETEINHENVATEIPHEHIEEIVAGQVDCSHTENDEHLEKESAILPLEEAPVEETNDNEFKLHESKELIKGELLENERNTVTASVKEETQEEKNTNYLQATHDDTNASESTHVTHISSTGEEILTAEPQDISNDKAQEKATAAAAKTHELQDIETITLDGEDKNDSLIKEDGSEITHEARFVEEQSLKADLLEEEKHEEVVLKEEVPTESLQVSDEDTKAASAFVQDREISSLEEQRLTTESHGVMCDNEDKTKATIIEKESQNAVTTTSYEDSEENSQTKVDVSQLEQRKHLEEESENKPLTEASARDTIENALAEEEAEMENPIDNMQVATEDTKAFSSCQTIETSSIKEQIVVADPHEISSDKIEENTVGAAYTEEKTAEDDETKVPNRDNEDNLPKEMYAKDSLETTNDDASINIHEAMFVDENLTKANLFENEKNIECTSLEKEVVIESLKEADEDIKACATFQDRETASLVDQDQIMDHKITEATKLKEETPDEKDIETNITSGKSEDNSATKVDDLQGTSLTEVPDYDSKIMHEPRLVDERFLKADSVGNEKNADGASEEHMMISNEHIVNVTSSASEPSEQDIDKTYTEKLPMLDNCSITQTSTNEDPTKSVHADSQGPNEGINSNNLTDVSDSSKSVALEEVSSSNVASETYLTSNPSQGSRKETRVEAENEDAQKQDEEDLCVSAPVQDSSIEKDAKSCPEITREMQKQEEAPLPASDEKTVKSTDYEESEVAEDKIITESENKETECKQENIFLDETVEEIKETASIPVANDVVPKSFIETSEIDHSTANLQTRETHTDDDEETKIDKEEEACELIISELDSSSPAPNITEASDMDGANRSIAELKAKIDDEAPEIIQAVPGVTESQEVEVIKVGEASDSVSECEREDCMHAKIDIEEKTDSDEVEFASEESKAGHEVKTQVLGNVQSCGMISKAEENLETAAEIKSGTFMVEDIIEAKETAKTNISSQKVKSGNSQINEEDDVKNDHINSCKDITETHLENQAKQEENTNTREIFEVIKNGNETEKVSEVLEEADDEAVEEPQEYVDNNREDKTIDATDLKAETFGENAPKSVVVEIHSMKDSDVNKEHVLISNEIVANVTSSVSEPLEQDIDMIDAEKITVIDDGSTKIPTNEDLAETGPTESSVKVDGQVPDEEIKIEESEQQDTAVGISEDVSKSNLEDIPETDSTPNPSLESAAKNEEAQKQDEDGLRVSASVQDSSTEKIEKDVESYLARAIDSETTQKIQKLEEATKSFLNDEKHTEREHDEIECKQEKALLDETVEETKEPASVVVTVADDVIPKSFTDYSSAEGWLTINRGDARTHDDEEKETKLDKNKEDGAGEPKISDFSSPATDIIEASGKDESKIGYEAHEIIQTAPSATETRELENINVSASISQRERDGKQSNEFGFSPEESKTGYEVKNQVLENVQSCGVISKVEDNLEAEIKCETVIVEDMIEPKEIKEEDEYVKNDHLGSCEEEAIAEGQIKDQPKQEEKANSEETFEVITKENVMEKVPKVSEEEDGKAVEEKLQTNESIDSSLHQKGQGNSVDNVTTISGTEKVRELDHSHIISTGTRDSEEEVNKSSVKFLEDEDKSTDIVENEIAKEEGLLNQISNTSMKDAVSKEQPKRPDEYMVYEAPPAQRVPKIIEDGEDKKVNADTIMIQHQEEYKKSRHESDPLEKQDKNDEICLSGELQTKDEVNLMLSAEKDEDEPKKEGTLSKPTEDKDEITYTEAEKVNVPSHSEDTAQSDKKQECERQIDSLQILPVAKCSDIETAVKDLPTEYSGLGADHNNDINPENSVGNKKPTAIESELPKNSVLETDEATCEREVKPSQGTATPTSQTEKTDVAEHEDTETGEEKNELSEQNQLELCSEAPVMVDIGDADPKVAHKKSHNILSGVGSKVKHSIAKVKKAITGKSSHPKPPATIIQSNLPPSPK